MLDRCDSATEHCHAIALFRRAFSLAADVILLAIMWFNPAASKPELLFHKRMHSCSPSINLSALLNDVGTKDQGSLAASLPILLWTSGLVFVVL